MRFPSLPRLSIPAASLIAALHAGTALACPGFPAAVLDNCDLISVAFGQQPVGTAADHLALTFPFGPFGPFVPGGLYFDSGHLATGLDVPYALRRVSQETLDGLLQDLDDAEKAFQDAHKEWWRRWHEARERGMALFAELEAARQALEEQRRVDPDAQAEIAFREHAIGELTDELHDTLNQMSLGSEEYEALGELEQARDDAREAFLEAGGELDGVDTAATVIFGEDASPATPPPPPPAADEPIDIEAAFPSLIGLSW